MVQFGKVSSLPIRLRHTTPLTLSNMETCSTMVVTHCSSVVQSPRPHAFTHCINSISTYSVIISGWVIKHESWVSSLKMLIKVIKRRLNNMLHEGSVRDHKYTVLEAFTYRYYKPPGSVRPWHNIRMLGNKTTHHLEVDARAPTFYGLLWYGNTNYVIHSS